MLLTFLLELGQSLRLVFLHEVVIFEIKIVFDSLIELLGIQVFPVVILLDIFLLVPKNVL
jgi:hypothetical protein